MLHKNFQFSTIGVYTLYPEICSVFIIQFSGFCRSLECTILNEYVSLLYLIKVNYACESVLNSVSCMVFTHFHPIHMKHSDIVPHVISGIRVSGFGYGTSIPGSARPAGYEILPITIPMGIFLYQTLPIYSEYPSGYRVSGTHCHP